MPKKKPKPLTIRDRVVELRRVKASELIANPKNWRTHPDAQKAAMRGILAEVGYVDALMARELPGGTLQLIDGHLRADVSPDAIVPVLVVDLDEAEAAKVLATFDPLAAMAETNAVALDELLRELDVGDAALQEMLAGLADDAGLYQQLEGATAGEVTEDEIPEPPKVPVTKPGDVWLLGDNRLMCGDSTSQADVDRLMGGLKADLCFTSPPYGQQRDYTAEGKAKCADWEGLMRGVFGCLPMADAGQVLVNLGLIHRENEWQPYWEPWIEWMRAQGWRRFGWYVWDQGFGLPGNWNGRLAPSHEFVFHFNRDAQQPAKWIGKKSENIKKRNEGESTMRGKDGKTKKFTNPAASAQPTKIPDSIIRVGRQVGSDGHPAQFPVAFPAFAMNCWPGLAYEPFSGSGTTIIAAEQLNRLCHAMEISPQYCDVACLRWEKLTGKKAVLCTT